MKLTKEQVEDIASARECCALGWNDFFLNYEFPDPPAEPNTTRWYHCSERLPNDSDLDEAGDVSCWENRVFTIRDCGELKPHKDIWWTPAPKKLVKPTPPDPFEEWWNKEFNPKHGYPFDSERKAQFKEAFEAGKAQSAT